MQQATLPNRRDATISCSTARSLLLSVPSTMSRPRRLAKANADPERGDDALQRRARHMPTVVSPACRLEHYPPVRGAVMICKNFCKK